ncbi:hypothetical protein JCM17960_20070 [Magnetospira thiophila]
MIPSGFQRQMGLQQFLALQFQLDLVNLKLMHEVAEIFGRFGLGNFAVRQPARQDRLGPIPERTVVWKLIRHALTPLMYPETQSGL